MSDFGTYELDAVETLGVSLGRHAFGGRGTPRRMIEQLIFSERAEPIDAMIWDGRVKLRLPQASSIKYLISDSRYNAEERAFLSDAMQPGDVIADIGANIGFYTLWLAAERMPDTHILAFEPNPAVYSALKTNLAINGFDNVTPVQAAVGEENRTASLGLAPHEPGTSSLLNTDAEQIDVNMVTLASALAQEGHTKCDLIKIDVEGYEYSALVPYFETTAATAWPRVVLLEKNSEARHWQACLIEYLTDRGYDVALKTRSNLALTRRV